MSKTNLVVEGSSALALLKKNLPKSTLAKCRFVVGDGRSSAISTARTLLTLGDEPLGLILDADDDGVDRQQTVIGDLLDKASHGQPFKVFFAVPNLDCVFRSNLPVNKIPLISQIRDFVTAPNGHAAQHA